VRKEVEMRIVGCGLVGLAVLLGPTPMAVAGEPAAGSHHPATASTATGPGNRTATQTQAGPQTEVSMLAVSLTAGGAVAAAGSGVALAVTRRRSVGNPPR
jgi:hypothetical protein